MLKSLVAFALALTPAPLLAWSNQGHMASGAIAHDALVASDLPAVFALERLILTSHPDRARFAEALRGLSGPARTRRLFEMMARWPDDARESSYDRPSWHYYGRIVSGGTWATFAVGNADTAFVDNLRILRDAKATPAARAVAACWVFHIVGDMHQPLHAGHRLSWRFPFTDRLGTIAWVKRSDGEIEIALHQYWDQALDTAGDETRGAERIADAAMAVPLTAAQLNLPGDPAAAFAAWTAESVALARRRGYTPEVLAATRDPAAAPLLSARYALRTRAIALVRLRQAGERLAVLLRGLR